MPSLDRLVSLRPIFSRWGRRGADNLDPFEVVGFWLILRQSPLFRRRFDIFIDGPPEEHWRTTLLATRSDRSVAPVIVDLEAPHQLP